MPASHAAVLAVVFAGAAALALAASPRLVDHGASVPEAAGVTVIESVTAPVATSRAVSPGSASASRVTQVLMRNVDFHADSTIVLRITHLRGTVRGRDGGPIVFDDKNSFTFGLAWAEVAVTARDLGALLNRYVFAFEGAPLRDLDVRIRGAEIEQSGKLKKGLWIPFRIRATVHATDDGRIRLHPTRVRVLGIPAEGVMRWLGIALEDMVSMDRVRGLAVDGNDLLLDPSALLPAPKIEGRVTSVRLNGDRLVQIFGSERAAADLGRLRAPVAPDGNYMFYRGGTLRFGKLVMYDADLEIVDMDPRDPFRFFLDRYNDQLVAGYSRTLPDLGLAAYMKDLEDLAPEPATPRDTARGR